MLAVQVSPRRRVYVSFTDDTHPNKGGYFCQVYQDEDMEFEIDNFVIQSASLKGAEDKLKRAYIIANSTVKSMLK